MTDPQVKPESTDELDDWFDEVDTEEDQSAPTEEIVPEETSAPETSSEESPDPQTPEVTASTEDDDATATGTSDEPEQEEGPYSWINQLDPELRQHAEALVHRESTQSGRVAALKSRLDEVSARVQAQETAKAVPAKAAPVEANQDVPVDETLKQFTEQYPTVADNVQKLIEQRVAAERAALEAEIRPLKETRIAEEALREKTRLREEAARIFNSAETGIELEEVVSSEVWREWMDSQPAGYQEFARTANRAEDAAKVLEDFAGYAERKAYEEYLQTNPTATEPATSEADQVAAQRAQALKGTGTPSKSGRLKGSELSTYDDWFDYYASEEG
jgi:adenosyl cobinamide kinase/adenosyl cobinamide phosphate guanylyltransferase